MGCGGGGVIRRNAILFLVDGIINATVVVVCPFLFSPLLSFSLYPDPDANLPSF